MIQTKYVSLTKNAKKVCIVTTIHRPTKTTVNANRIDSGIPILAIVVKIIFFYFISFVSISHLSLTIAQELKYSYNQTGCSSSEYHHLIFWFIFGWKYKFIFWTKANVLVTPTWYVQLIRQLMAVMVFAHAQAPTTGTVYNVPIWEAIWATVT